MAGMVEPYVFLVEYKGTKRKLKQSFTSLEALISVAKELHKIPAYTVISIGYKDEDFNEQVIASTLDEIPKKCRLVLVEEKSTRASPNAPTKVVLVTTIPEVPTGPITVTLHSDVSSTKMRHESIVFISEKIKSLVSTVSSWRALPNSLYVSLTQKWGDYHWGVVVSHNFIEHYGYQNYSVTFKLASKSYNTYVSIRANAYQRYKTDVQKIQGFTTAEIDMLDKLTEKPHVENFCHLLYSVLKPSCETLFIDRTESTSYQWYQNCKYMYKKSCGRYIVTIRMIGKKTALTYTTSTNISKLLNTQLTIK
mmetsp:Transcript_1009/g.1149  ORF Transcript_1009/g.1149 Transcript_1009/m.1149 type:complete len:308 (+) Transcript_1009:1-924(+)